MLDRNSIRKESLFCFVVLEASNLPQQYRDGSVSRVVRRQESVAEFFTQQPVQEA